MLFPGQLDQILILDTIIYILQNLLKKRSRRSLKIFAKNHCKYKINFEASGEAFLTKPQKTIFMSKNII